MLRSMIAGLCLAIAAPTAHAQVLTVKPYTGVVRESFADVVKKQNETMRISIGMNFMLTGVGDPIADDAKLREKTRRNVYQIALRECELIIEMIASECRIETININLNRNNPQSLESVNVNATIALRASPK